MTGIYIHVPFCRRKCNYCGFFSESGKENLMEAYAGKIIKEAKKYSGECADTVYFGGGTPSLLGDELLTKILCGIKDIFNIEKNSEITLEANPKTVDRASLCRLREAGFNRISFGFQSFCDSELALLGRIHSAKDNEIAVKWAREAGFDNISGDIISAVPGQKMENIEYSVDKMLSLGLSHISAYSLIVEEGTPFYNMRDELALPDEDTERKMYWYIADRLEKAGYEHYEISNFAKDGKRSRHNTKYWTNEPYIGLGAGAHSYYGGFRYSNVCNTEKYIAKDYTEDERTAVCGRDAEEEKYMLGLRMKEGVLYTPNEKADKYIKLGYLKRHGDNICLTKKGIDVADYIIADIIA